MTKFYLTLAAVLLVVLTSSTSAHTNADIVVGGVAPEISLSETKSLSDFRGSYVLLSFWNAENAESRLATRSLEVAARSADPEGERITVIGVNVSDSSDIFDGIVTLDGLDRAQHFRPDIKAATETIRNYHLADGLRTLTGSMLVAPDGTIAAVNPTAETIAAL